MTAPAAVTVEQYLDQLPPERRQVIETVRRTILENLPAGYQETVAFGMISYCIPLATYPRTYNGQPLSFAALAAQKNYYALYLHNVYSDPALEERLRAGFAAAGRKLDIGKSCVRFRRVDDLPLDVIGEIIGATPPVRHIEVYEASRAETAARRKG